MVIEKEKETNKIATRHGQRKDKRLIGDAGYRSPYLSHAKQALYHLTYIPIVKAMSFFIYNR